MMYFQEGTHITGAYELLNFLSRNKNEKTKTVHEYLKKIKIIQKKISIDTSTFPQKKNIYILSKYKNSGS